MNKAKYDLDSLSTEELEGMVKIGKMAEYILSHREVDRAERLKDIEGIQRIKRSFEVLKEDCSLQVVRFAVNKADNHYSVIAWREASGEFEFSMLHHSGIKPGETVEFICNNYYTPLANFPYIRTNVEKLYDQIIVRKGQQRSIYMGLVEPALIFDTSTSNTEPL
ncbi:hypothetical protein [Yersinia ruckeri]|uniref:hypothetical protein n=1 Tax=Yersinia ruckeri TaxID=29486 RepID=UPI002237F3FC|nr:hypothetical protein [Yersinia ruckeri]MCW6598640.1 hypothetical protein [Yersinia ruckeri]